MSFPMAKFSDLLNPLITFIILIKKGGCYDTRPLQRVRSLYPAKISKFRSIDGDIFFFCQQLLGSSCIFSHVFSDDIYKNLSDIQWNSQE